MTSLFKTPVLNSSREKQLASRARASYFVVTASWLLVSWPSSAGSSISVYFGGRTRVLKTIVLFKTAVGLECSGSSAGVGLECSGAADLRLLVCSAMFCLWWEWQPGSLGGGARVFKTTVLKSKCFQDTLFDKKL